MQMGGAKLWESHTHALETQKDKETIRNDHKENPQSALRKWENMLVLYEIITLEKDKQDAYETEEIQKYFTCLT